MNEDLTALLFELRRTASKADKARALARAWRTVRELSTAERRMLAREVGFDGAEELIEGIAGQGGGVFSPAAVLEALGRVRRDEGFSLRGLLRDLRDPETRDDLLVRGIDLVADSLNRPDRGDNGHNDDADVPPAYDLAVELDRLPDELDGLTPAPSTPPAPNPISEAVPAPKSVPAAGPAPEPAVDPDPEAVPAAVAVPDPEPAPAAAPMPDPDCAADTEPVPDPKASPWDLFVSPIDDGGAAAVDGLDPAPAGVGTQPDGDGGSVLQRLGRLRSRLPSLRGAVPTDLAAELDAFPEPWARRRALVALIEAGIPDEVTAALDLIELLDRQQDRSWCLSALARCGDLAGGDLDRALAMLASPAAKRRVAALAARRVAPRERCANDVGGDRARDRDRAGNQDRHVCGEEVGGRPTRRPSQPLQ